MRFKAITRLALATLVGAVLLGAGATAPAWGDLPPHAHLSVTPSSGPAGATVELQGSGYVPNLQVKISFTDANGTRGLFWIWADSIGSFKTSACVPADAVPGNDYFVAESPQNQASGLAMFQVYRAATRPGNVCV